MSNRGKRFIRREVDWPNRFRCSPLPFQTGDKVAIANGTTGIITAVGKTGLHHNVYRVGRKSYWYAFQLKLLARPRR